MPAYPQTRRYIMTLWVDDIQKIKDIARQIAKEEIEATSAKLKELAEELGRQIRNLKSEKPKESEKPVGKDSFKK